MTALGGLTTYVAAICLAHDPDSHPSVAPSATANLNPSCEVAAASSFSSGLFPALGTVAVVHATEGALDDIQITAWLA
jgi:hypothetical protein